ncbi:MAG: Holliday junction branch migration protein RuvA [Microbacteriaceae bacterium]
MIASVRGTVLAVSGSSAVLEVGGVGLAVQVTPQTALTLRIGSEATLHTALIVREDDLSLFGFVARDELEIFDLLRGVSGVGPKSALGVLATLTPDDIAHAVAAEDDAPFRKVSGIGPKTAKLIALSLQGKLVPATASRLSTGSAARSTITQDVVTALVGLGWNERAAAAAVEEAAAEASETDRATVASLLRLSLSRLGPGVRS